MWFVCVVSDSVPGCVWCVSCDLCCSSLALVRVRFAQCSSGVHMSVGCLSMIVCVACSG